VSGAAAIDIVAACVATEEEAAQLYRRGTSVVEVLCKFTTGTLVPCRLYVWNTTSSYTREPLLEMHAPGSPPLLEALVEIVCRHGARLATPGEFTLRAFLAGRIDLTQAEGVLGVIDARSQQELQLALEQLSGGLAHPLSRLRETLLNLLADLEAELDFAEEGIEFVPHTTLLALLSEGTAELSRLLLRIAERGSVQPRLRVLLYGPANAGKSSLFNALAPQAQAIVSPTAGTTRDVLRADVTFAGVQCQLLDSAGLTAPTTEDPIANLALAKTHTAYDQAHVRLLCLDGSHPLSDEAWNAMRQCSERCLVVQTKSDLPAVWKDENAVCVSSATGAGLDLLQEEIARRITTDLVADTEAVTATALRCTDALRRAQERLSQAQASCTAGVSRELIAGDVRLTLDELGQILGVVVTDDILDRLFSRFCIGK
jgi:tRNA modification GTPase